jgi:acyl-CoA synthetase (AMP-forming)/AMP-acid ligase II
VSERAAGRADQRWGTIPRLVSDAAARFDGSEAVVDGSVRLSFTELAAAVREAAGGMIALGVKAGERVAVWAPNSHRWMVAALAATSVGGVLVPLNTRYRGSEAAWILRRSRASVLVVSDVFLGNDYLAMLADQGPLPDLRRIISVGDDAMARGALTAMSWPSFLAKAAETDPEVLTSRWDGVSRDDPADICFTSGTTGNPKGVVVTHAQNLRAMEAWADLSGLRAGDRYLVVNPFFHTFGYKAGILTSLLRGATILPHKVLDVDAVLDTVERERITVLPGPPALYQSLLDSPASSHFLSSLRLAVTGAAVVPVQLVERLRDEVGCEVVLTAYGLTESTGMATMCRPEDDPVLIATTSGRAIADVEVRTVRPDGSQCDTGEVGEVVIRGYNVMLGYLDDPESTAAAIDPDGWLHTGDLGSLDDAGYLKITDRLKDMYICGGFNVYPAEVEQVIARLDDVEAVSVIGVPERRLGEVGAAFIVLRQGSTMDPATVIDWCREHLANFKAPRHVRFVEQLPKNAMGKVTKNDLRSLFVGGPHGPDGGAG